MARIRLALFALAVAAAPLGAQQTTNALPLTPAPVSNAVEAPAPREIRGPMIDGARVAVHMPQSSELATPAAARMGLGQARALMIVGGAALLAGAIVGGDAGAIIMVGGAVIGLVGLYEYLQ